MLDHIRSCYYDTTIHSHNMFCSANGTRACFMQFPVVYFHKNCWCSFFPLANGILFIVWHVQDLVVSYVLTNILYGRMVYGSLHRSVMMAWFICMNAMYQHFAFPIEIFSSTFFLFLSYLFVRSHFFLCYFFAKTHDNVCFIWTPDQSLAYQHSYHHSFDIHIQFCRLIYSKLLNGCSFWTGQQINRLNATKGKLNYYSRWFSVYFSLLTIKSNGKKAFGYLLFKVRNLCGRQNNLLSSTQFELDLK